MDRKGFIGGSDLYKLEHDSNWFDLWQIKTGRREPDDLSHMFNVNLGVETELFNMRWFEIQTDIMVTDTQVEYTKNWHNIPCKGTLDGVLANGNIIECKHTSSFNNMADVLDRYMGQIQFYMWVANKPAVHMSVIFGNQWETCRVSQSSQLMDQYMALIKEFWEYVRLDIAPGIREKTKIDWSSVDIDGLSIRDASKENAFVDAAHTYISTLDYAKRHDASKKELRSMIKEDEREVYCDMLAVRRSKNGSCRIVVNKESVNG